MKYQEIKEQICDICHRMWQQGWVAANDGNITVRVGENEVIATPTGISKSFITPDMLVLIDLDGNILEAKEGYRPSSETKMHLCCYKEREDVKSVVHAHPPTATGFAVAHVHMDNYSMIESVIAIGSVPVTPYGTPSTMEVPDSIEEFLPHYDQVLLANHGALAWGADLLSAYHKLESVEFYAELLYKARMLGNPKSLNEEQVEKLYDIRRNMNLPGKHIAVDK
jgi:L-fuculose-phosphate aldolase